MTGTGGPHGERRTEIGRGAQRDARGVTRFYAERSPRLASDFLTELRRVLLTISARPHTGAPYAHRYRRMLLRRFPYAVVYRELPDGHLRVLAITHLRRRPDHWLNRDDPRSGE